MNYEETLNFLFSQLPMYQRVGKAAYKADLKNSIALCNTLNNPQNNFKSIHIAGTNGKGSTSSMLASILQEKGLKVGLYTSPHLSDYRERIRINGEMISKDYVVDFVEKNKLNFLEIQPSFFEMTMAMAFQYFSDKNIDIAVIETGLGGRLDSTNIIQPLLSIITNIGLDHTQFLGNTIEEIANEKAGIIKPNTPVVIGEHNEYTKPVFVKKAKKENAQIFFCSQNYELTFEIGLKGSYQKKNTKTVLKSVEVLNNLEFNISDDNIANGLKNVVSNTGIKGRWQVLNESPLTICDVGHNKEGIKEVVDQINQQKFENLHFVLGMVNDKNVVEVLKLLPKKATYYLCQPNIPRALPINILEEAVKKVNLTYIIGNTVNNAYKLAKEKSNEKDMIFIGGSTFVVAEVV